jgi:hypothetical protein
VLIFVSFRRDPCVKCSKCIKSVLGNAIGNACSVADGERHHDQLHAVRGGEGRILPQKSMNWGAAPTTAGLMFAERSEVLFRAVLAAPDQWAAPHLGQCQGQKGGRSCMPRQSVVVISQLKDGSVSYLLNKF